MARKFKDLTAGQASDQTIRAQQATIRELHEMVKAHDKEIRELRQRCQELERMLAKAAVAYSGLAVSSGLLHVR